MGNKPAVYTGTDGRVEKVINKIGLNHSEFTLLYKLFVKHDKVGEGFITRDGEKPNYSFS